MYICTLSKIDFLVVYLVIRLQFSLFIIWMYNQILGAFTNVAITSIISIMWHYFISVSSQRQSSKVVLEKIFSEKVGKSFRKKCAIYFTKNCATLYMFCEQLFSEQLFYRGPVDGCFSVGIWLFKVKEGNTRAMWEIYSKVIIKAPERHY